MATHIVTDKASANRARRALADQFSIRRFQDRVARANNESARKIKARLTQEIPRHFDRPTPFTVDSVRVIPVKRGGRLSQMQMTIHLAPIQSEYMRPSILGETVTEQFGRSPFLVPVLANIQRFGRDLGLVLDQFGNINDLRNGVLSGLLNNPRVFFAGDDGSLEPGVYVRVDDVPAALFVQRRQQTYDAIFPFHEISLKVYRECFPDAWRNSFR